MEALRQIPPVNDVLRSPELSAFRDILSQPFAAAIIDSVFSEVRRELTASQNGVSRSELTSKIAQEVGRRLRRRLEPSLRRVINGTGVVLHTNLGRAPLPEGAIEHLREVSIGYSNLEFDVDQGKRGKRDAHAGSLLQELLGCEAAIVVNNNAAAVFLILNTLGGDGDVLVSRGELVEIGESFRIPDIMERSGARLCEIGSTNRTRIKDYEDAIGERTQLLLRVHRSNFQIVGFTERPSLREFATLGQRHHIPTFEDLGSGYLTGLPSSIATEPSVRESIDAGVDVVSFSGDKMLGGPQAGIIAGRKIYIDRIRRNPLFRALRVDKLTLSVLEYILRAHLQGDVAAVPVLKLLRASETELKARVEAFARRVGNAATPVALKSIVGGGAAPETDLSSWGVALALPGTTARQLEERFRLSSPPVIVRVEGDQVVLDFRTIFPAEEKELIEILNGLRTEPSDR
jgi:L-seryl-tRNA(Ser) seleniumtransferase